MSDPFPILNAAFCEDCELSMVCLMERCPEDAELCMSCRGIWLPTNNVTVHCYRFMKMLRNGARNRGLSSTFGLGTKGTTAMCGRCCGASGARRIDGHAPDRLPSIILPEE